MLRIANLDFVAAEGFCVSQTHLVFFSGNLHFNATTPEYSPEVMNQIEPYIYDWVSRHQGSVSAEHGLGFKKRNFIYHTKSASAVRLMQVMKKSLDPHGILNPYKVLPSPGE